MSTCITNLKKEFTAVTTAGRYPGSNLGNKPNPSRPTPRYSYRSSIVRQVFLIARSGYKCLKQSLKMCLAFIQFKNLSEYLPQKKILLRRHDCLHNVLKSQINIWGQETMHQGTQMLRIHASNS